MEQAEQFFTAAEAVGPATKPVLLFYALSQASRSIAAASVSAAQAHWRLGGGHGLTVGPMQGVGTSGLSSLTMQDHGRGTFTGLANILSVASLPSETKLGDLWCLIPGLNLASLQGMGGGTPLVLQREEALTAGGYHIPSRRTRVTVSPLPGTIVRTGLPPGQAMGDLQGEIEAQRSAASVYLNQYPTLAGWSFLVPDGNPIGAMWLTAEAGKVPIMLGHSGGDPSTEEADLASRTFNYQGESYAFPRVGGSDLAAHPLLIWYAVLYGLSMLSRYEPRAWAGLIDIDLSKDASPIEAALEEAGRSLPQVILQTLHDVVS